MSRSPRACVVIGRRALAADWIAVQASAHGWVGVLNLAGIPYETLFVEDLVTRGSADFSCVVAARVTHLEADLREPFLAELARVQARGGLVVEGPLGLDAPGRTAAVLGIVFRGEGGGTWHRIAEGLSDRFVTGHLTGPVALAGFASPEGTQVLLSLHSKDESLPFLVTKTQGEGRCAVVGDLFTEGGAASFFHNTAPRTLNANGIHEVLVGVVRWAALGPATGPRGYLQLVHTDLALVLRLDGDHSHFRDQAEATLDYLADFGRRTGVATAYGIVTSGAEASGWDLFQAKLPAILETGGVAASHSRYHEIEAGGSDSAMTEVQWEEELVRSHREIGEFLTRPQVFINPGNTISMDHYGRIASLYPFYLTHGQEQTAPIGFGRMTWFAGRKDFVVLENSPAPDYQWFNNADWSYTTQELTAIQEQILRHYASVGRGVVFSPMWHDYAIADRNDWVEPGRIKNDRFRDLYDGVRSLAETLDAFTPSVDDLYQKLLIQSEGLYHTVDSPSDRLEGILDTSGLSAAGLAALDGMGLRIEDTGRRIGSVTLDGRPHHAFSDHAVILPGSLSAAEHRLVVDLSDRESEVFRLTFASKPVQVSVVGDTLTLKFRTPGRARFTLALPPGKVLDGPRPHLVQRGRVVHGLLPWSTETPSVAISITDEKPDRFGPYRALVTALHRPLVGWIEESCRLTPGSIDLEIHQMSIEEYLEEKHDEAYIYHRYGLVEDGKPYRNSQTFPLVLCLNPRAPGSDRIGDRMAEAVVSVLQDPLGRIGSLELEFQGTSSQLPLSSNDTIQTVHFFWKGEQLAKLVYCYDTFQEVFRELFRGGA